MKVSTNIPVLGLTASLILICCVGCSSGGGGDDEGDLTEATPTPVADESGLRTSCGVVTNGALRSPVSTERGEQVQIASVLDSNLVLVNEGGDQRLVKLHGLGGTSAFDNTAARKILEAHASSTLYYFRVSSDCEATIDGESAQMGQLVTADGESLSEELLAANVAGVVETSGECGENLVASCYKELGGQAGSGTGGGAENPDTENPDTGTDSPGEVTDFLWKPESESAYNPGGLSILLNPCNARVLVNGTEILDYGGTNGRCITARSSRSGCTYGSDVKVEAIDKKTGKPFTFGGATSIRIPNGCDRLEYEGDASGAPTTPSEETPACETAPATFQYVPASTACGGNAAIVTTGSLASYFSAQLRKADGGDRLDEGCAEKNCSPFKVQFYLDGEGSKTACFGAPGAANLMAEIEYATIKSTGDDSNPVRYCIPDPAVAVN